MRLQVKGKNVDVAAEIREYAEVKLGKLDKHIGADADVEVELSEERNPSISDNQVAEATVHLKGTTLRAREAATEMRIAVDRLHENLERQLDRYREKRREEPRRRAEHHA